MVEFVTSYLLPIGAGPGFLLKLFLPLVIAFLACRLVLYFFWTKCSRGSVQFSCTLVSMLSAPILTTIYFSLIRTIGTNTMLGALFIVFTSLAFFAPTLVIMPILLVVYVNKADPTKRIMSAVLVFAGLGLCLILQYLWFAFLLSQGH